MYKRNPPQGNILVEVCNCIGVSHLPVPLNHITWFLKVRIYSVLFSRSVLLWKYEFNTMSTFPLWCFTFGFAVCHQKTLAEIKERASKEALVGLGWGEVLGNKKTSRIASSMQQFIFDRESFLRMAHEKIKRTMVSARKRICLCLRVHRSVWSRRLRWCWGFWCCTSRCQCSGLCLISRYSTWGHKT